MKELTSRERLIKMATAIDIIENSLRGFNRIEQFGILEGVKLKLNNLTIEASILEGLREVEEE